MAFVHDQDPVEQFPAQGSDHPFANRIRSGCSGWAGEDLDAIVQAFQGQRQPGPTRNLSQLPNALAGGLGCGAARETSVRAAG